MVEVPNNDQEALERFFAQPDVLDKMAALAFTISPEDQDYIAEQVNEALDNPESYDVIQKRIMDFMDP